MKWKKWHIRGERLSFLYLCFSTFSTSCTGGWVMDDGDSDGWPPCCFTPWRLNQNQLSTVSCKWDNQRDIHHLLLAQKKKKWRVHWGGWSGTATRRERENSTTEISERGLILWADTKTDIKPFSRCHHSLLWRYGCNDYFLLSNNLFFHEWIDKTAGKKKLFPATTCPVSKSQKL